MDAGGVVQQQQQQCVICYEELTEGLSAAPCGHVFHTVCIDKWHKAGSFCPMCHAKLPPKLLRLFFEPQQPSGDTTSTTSSTSDAGATDSGACSQEGGGAKARPVSAEVTQLRRELASSNKFIEISKEACAQHKEKMKKLQDELLDSRTAALLTKSELEGTVKTTQAKLQTAQIDLCKKHKEVNRLSRLMEGTNERLRKFQGDQVAHKYLSQFSSHAAGARPLSDLGKVDVEVVLRQIGRGAAQADTVIRGQHEQLSGAMEREQKTKRELRQSKEEGEAARLELQQVRAKLLRAKKDAYHLEKALNKGRHEVLERGARVPSVGSFLDAAEGKLPKEGRRDSRVCSNQSGGRSIGAKGKSTKRPAPTGMVAGLGSIAALDAKGKRRKVAAEDEGVVSLSDGSDDDSGSCSGSDAVDEEEEGDEARGKQAGKEWTFAAVSRGQLERETRLTPALSSRRFLNQGAGGRAAKREPGKFIRSGFDAMGGRHNVRCSSTDRFGISIRGKQR